MDIGVISVRYARALLKSALNSKIEDQVYDDMLLFSKSYVEIPDLRQAIDNPMLDKDTKVKLLSSAMGDNHAPLSEGFMKLIVQEGRESMVQFMANSYVTLYRQHKNVIRGRLITAVAVKDSTKEKMRQMVEKKTNGTVEFVSEVNPDIIGGFYFRVRYVQT